MTSFSKRQNILVLQKKDRVLFHHNYKREILFGTSDCDVMSSIHSSVSFYNFCLVYLVTSISSHRPSPSSPSWHVAGLYKENVSERQCNLYSSQIILLENLGINLADYSLNLYTDRHHTIDFDTADKHKQLYALYTHWNVNLLHAWIRKNSKRIRISSQYNIRFKIGT